MTVHFIGSDTLSGVKTITSDLIISTEGASQSVVGTATDKADNSASTTVTGINIDKTPPSVTISSPGNGTEYILKQTILAAWSANDSLSGLYSATGTVASGQAIDTGIVGAKNFNVAATDKAGNQISQSVGYKVIYNYGGILPPIKGDGSSVFKLGSTVPVKFQLKDAGGSFVGTATARIIMQKLNNNVPSGDSIIPESTSSASIGNLFRYDTTEN